MLLSLYICCSILLIFAYIFIMAQYLIAWQELPEWEIPNDFRPTTKVSILIPARNEAENIIACLNTIAQQSYPSHLWEAIVLDDFSTDTTADLVKQFPLDNIHLIQLANFVQAGATQSYKKKAIEIGIEQAKGTLIVTTDADCLVQEHWLRLIVSLYESKDYQFIAAPVNFYEEQNALERFQSLDFMGMMGIAGGGIQRTFMRMCNGANLAYTKSAFQVVNGFDGINEMASGDDMLLMQKIAAQYPDAIAYLKHPKATTFTKAKPTLATFYQQRLRWATKSASYPEKLVTVILALVFFFCCNILLSALLSLVWNAQLIYILLLSLLVKAVMDYLFLSKMSQFFHRQDLLRSFLPSLFMHLLYIVFVGFAANLVKEYEWKGRRVK
ncbi:MAG: glycosyltransferase [Bacteroidota bacterium]